MYFISASTMPNTTTSKSSHRQRRRRVIAMVCFLILLCVLVAVVLYGIFSQEHSGSGERHSALRDDSVRKAGCQDTGDSGGSPDFLGNERDTAITDSSQGQHKVIRSHTEAQRVPGKKGVTQLEQRKKGASAGKRGDTLRNITSDTADMARKPGTSTGHMDTTAAYIYSDPSGGLHRSSISVVLHSSEPCSIVWKMRGDSIWRRFTGDSISVESTTVLSFYGIDSAGNRSDTLKEYYEIAYTASPKVCPDDMVYVEIGDADFCIDRYEWPNQKGIKPHAFVSLFQAQDSCFSVGKRLCTSEEWMMACAGPYAYTYPYGNTYNPRACNSKDTTVHASGRSPQCRSFFGAYDMTGNLAEWSNTRARENRRFYNVMGGFWESGSRASCAHRTYSYYPQNRHNPVGFRCCRDAQSTQE